MDVSTSINVEINYLAVSVLSQPVWSEQSAVRPARNLCEVEVGGGADYRALASGASKSSIRKFVITKKAPTRAFSWLKAATTAFTFETILRHYAKQPLTTW